MIDEQDKLYKDLEAVRQIPIVPTMLEVICQTTGMGFAAVARVTNERWLACSVRDEVQFGLPEGGELELETTLCNEVRNFRKPIIIDFVNEDAQYREHHTPRIYGLQSYISIPIILRDGTFFGTLCAIDSKPAKVNNPKVIATLTMFAELLSFHLQSIDLLDRSEQANLDLSHRNRTLTSINFDLDNFIYTASHDLKSPIANIESLLELLSEAVASAQIDKNEVHKITEMMKLSLKRFTVTIRDLTSIVEADQNSDDEVYEEISLPEIVQKVKQDLQQLIIKSDAQIEVICDEDLKLTFSKKNFKSIVYNLLSNALKYRSPERALLITIRMEKIDDNIHLSVQDNGLGIPLGKQDKVFSMFKRLHDHVEGSGIGLYIVKRMIDNVKGQIKVDSTLGKGTTFTIVF